MPHCACLAGYLWYSMQVCDHLIYPIRLLQLLLPGKQPKVAVHCLFMFAKQKRHKLYDFLVAVVPSQDA